MKNLVVLHANCQGEMLVDLLMQHAFFSKQYACILYTNYIKEHVPPEQLEKCSVFIYQHLQDNWGDIASKRLLTYVKPQCLTLSIPSFYNRMYWPLFSGGPEHEFRDKFLDELLLRGLSREELMLVAPRPRLMERYALDDILAASLNHEKGKQERTQVPYLDAMLSRWKSEWLFHTPNHPAKPLLLLVANEILGRLGFSVLTEEQTAPLDAYYTALQQPIHPGVALHFGLEFIVPNQTYNVYGMKMTYGQYAGVYMDYRASGIKNFIDYIGQTYGK